jgi:hypothetical protein
MAGGGVFRVPFMIDSARLTVAFDIDPSDLLVEKRLLEEFGTLKLGVMDGP